uniref:Uncharacterized protein n=1 Tax=Kwoniella bestiolae CBS 10118 TaxID=1296100 RepID=A0A1B9G4C7_9TREE|nr:hypothetical protein I302_03565 [Kwoniella bestiolae CBS 10118]OCF25889.1 hypothetical protein I302_03565 [Kwoniella bestiolae CBS 10118]
MELTEENAQAGDKAYLDLVLLQTLGSDRVNLIWCSIWGILVQAYLLGFLISKIWEIGVRWKRYEKGILGCVAVELALIIAQLGVSIDQTYRISFTSIYTDIAVDDSWRNVVGMICCGVMGGMSMGYGIWSVWKMSPRKRLIIPLIILNIISLGLIMGLSVISCQMPLASVSRLYLVEEWVNRQGVLMRCWLGMGLVSHAGVWIIMVWLIRSKREFDKGRRLVIVAQALAVEVPSLANASRPIFQSFSPLHLLSFIYLLRISHPVPTSTDDGENGGIRLSESESISIYYKSPPVSRRGLLPDSYSGYTTSTSSGQRSIQSSKSGLGMGSVKVSIDQIVTESKSVTSPPSAYKFKDKQPIAHIRYPSSSTIASPIPTPRYSNSGYSDVPLSIIAPFSEWLEYNSTRDLPSDSNNDNEANNDKMSYKSAVPSGKTLYRSKSERSKKDGGIVLDHTGWDVAPIPVPLPPPMPASVSSTELQKEGRKSGASRKDNSI